jgi:hypothetical protein
MKTEMVDGMLSFHPFFDIDARYKHEGAQLVTLMLTWRLWLIYKIWVWISDTTWSRDASALSNFMTYLVTFVLYLVDVFDELWLLLFSGKRSSCRRRSLIRKCNRSSPSEWGGKCWLPLLMWIQEIICYLPARTCWNIPCIRCCFLLYIARVYSTSNSTKSPASGARVSDLRFMSQVGTVREVVCA